MKEHKEQECSNNVRTFIVKKYCDVPFFNLLLDGNHILNDGRPHAHGWTSGSL